MIAAHSNVVDALDREWGELSGSRRLREALRRWAERDPALDFESPAALVSTLERRDHDPAATDAVLGALARRARTDDLAARLLLQLVLPGCKRLLRLYGRGDPDEWAAFIVTTAWDRIRRYPIDRRPRSVAANILLDVRQRVVRAARRQRPGVPLHLVAEEDLPSVRPGPDPAAELVGVVGSAVRRGGLDLDAARLVVLTRMGAVSVAELARREQTCEQTVRQRRRRAEARLRRMVAA